MRGVNVALRNISLTIGAGEHVAILGPNGCGKSTLIKTITRECYPLAQPGSSVTILGERVWNVVDLRTMLGIVSNDLMAQCTREITGFEIVLSGFFSSIVFCAIVRFASFLLNLRSKVVSRIVW